MENPIFNNFLQKEDFPLFFNNPHFSFHIYRENFSSLFQNPPISTFSPHICRTIFQAFKGIVLFFHMSTFTTTNTTLLFLSSPILMSHSLLSPPLARSRGKDFKRVEKHLSQTNVHYTERIFPQALFAEICIQIHKGVFIYCLLSDILALFP